MVNVGLLTMKLRTKIGRMDGRRIFLSLAKIVPVSMAMGAIGWWISRNPMWESPGNSLVKSEWLVGGIAASVIFYLVTMWLLKSEELEFMWGIVKRRRKK